MAIERRSTGKPMAHGVQIGRPGGDGVIRMIETMARRLGRGASHMRRRRHALWGTRPWGGLTAMAANCLLVALVAFPAPSPHDSTLGPAIYVSPNGNDLNPGTESLPVQTIGRAQALVRTMNRNMTADLTVYLEDGTYRLRRTLRLGPQDSGTNGYRVIWTGVSGAIPIISGGIQATNWRLTNEALNIWSTRVPVGVRTRQIYVNGQRASLTTGLPPVALSRWYTGYQAATSVMAHWRNPGDIDFVYTSQLGDAVEPICPVGSISGRYITMAEPCWSNSNLRVRNYVGFGSLQQPSYIQNAYELLRKPGQFYLDRRARVLSYIPRAGEDLSTADVEVPRLQLLVTGVGTSRQPVHDISFSNIQFSYATWIEPSLPNGFSEMQSGLLVTGRHGYDTQGLCHLVPRGTCPYGAWTKEPGNVDFRYDRDISFTNDRFVHLGAAGLNLDNGSQHDTVVGSVFTDISGNGLEVGNVNLPTARGAFRTTDIQVLDNHIYGVPDEFHGGASILMGYVSDSVISHNQIDHTPYVAISTGWGGWLDKTGRPSVENFSHNNVISHNLIFDIMNVVADGGGIYTQGLTGSSFANGQKVIGNVVHGQLDWGSALKADDGAGYVTYAGNVLYDNIYDWAGVHWDYRKPRARRFLPLLVKGNWWQQGDPNFSMTGFIERGNHLIAGPQDVPAAVIANAGLEREYRSLLTWQPAPAAVPQAPTQITILYAFGGRAWVTWHPSYVQGTSPVESYTISACKLGHRPWYAPCGLPQPPPVTVPASKLNDAGFAVFPGLRNHTIYRFMVTATNQSGTSMASIPSAPSQPIVAAPGLPLRPTRVTIHPGVRAVSLQWYRPTNVAGNRALGQSGRGIARTTRRTNRVLILGYRVTSSSGLVFTVAGHNRLISTNKGGRVLLVARGLDPSKKYVFAIRAIDPAGIGKPEVSRPVQPYSH